LPDVVPANRVDGRYLVPALTRGREILSALSGERRSLTLSDVAASLGVTRSSAYRLLYTLVHLGFVIYDADSKSYQLGPEILNLGVGYLASRDLVEVAMPHLNRLRDRTGWSAHLGELHGAEVVYLARVATRRSIASTVHVGTRLPARVTTMGRVLLSGLSEQDIRDLYGDDLGIKTKAAVNLPGLLDQLAADRVRGFVVQNSVYEPGVASVAAPVRDMTDRIVAAINISAVAMFTDDAELNGPLRTEVVAAAQAISREIGRSAEIAGPLARSTLGKTS
jgi:DNA-binding IclR family transcriptional regulator